MADLGTAVQAHLRDVEARAAAVASLLRALANERRLMVLCRLVETGEATVGTLAAGVGLSQSALSQHLAVMRDEGLVATRRAGQSIWYRISDPRVAELLATLERLYCAPGVDPRSIALATTPGDGETAHEGLRPPR